MSDSTSEEKREFLFKVLVIGELATGKTAFVKRYVHNFFSDNYRSTIGVDFALKLVKYDDDTLIRLQLWDIAGQERFGNMTRVYYKDAVGCFIVFDVSREATFEAVTRWKADLDSKVRLAGDQPVPCVLLANKCDLVTNGDLTDSRFLDQFCREKGFVKWFQTSTKENINIDESGKFLVDEIMKFAQTGLGPDDSVGDGIIKPGEPAQKPSTPSKGCCGGSKS